MIKRLYFLLFFIVLVGVVVVYFINVRSGDKGLMPLKHLRGFMEQHLLIDKNIRKIEVFKKKRLMKVYFGDTFKLYRVALGTQPIGHKKQEGDRKTPEGTYFITIKNPHSQGYKSLKISYPNDEDCRQARSRGVSPGGDVCIHGLFSKNQDPETHWEYDWTWGCVAVNNTEIDEIYKWCKVGTEVKIWP